MPDNATIWQKANEIATTVITGIHGPRPVVPSSCTPGYLHAASEAQWDAVFGAVDGQRAWDRRVKALTNALATEARRIEDRGIVRRMEPARVRRVATIAAGAVA